MKKSLLALAAIASLTVSAAGPVLAYPAGQNPTIGLSSVSRITPGDPIKVSVSRVKRDCSVTVDWVSGSAASVTGTAGRTGKTPVLSIATPSTAGVYSLRIATSSTCAGTANAFSTTKSITVGKIASIVAKLGTTSGFASKNPTISVSGTVKSGSLPVEGKLVTLTLKKTGMFDKITTFTTTATGTFNAAFSGTNYTAGSYVAVVSFNADNQYGAKSLQTKSLTIR